MKTLIKLGDYGKGMSSPDTLKFLAKQFYSQRYNILKTNTQALPKEKLNYKNIKF